MNNNNNINNNKSNTISNERQKTALLDLEIKNKWKNLYLEEINEKEKNRKRQVIKYIIFKIIYCIIIKQYN